MTERGEMIALIPSYSVLVFFFFGHKEKLPLWPIVQIWTAAGKGPGEVVEKRPPTETVDRIASTRFHARQLMAARGLYAKRSHPGDSRRHFRGSSFRISRQKAALAP
jgi:hypothetical protein